ncbi:hypothetical protein TRIHO_37660 [Tritonibacter horizontis]|uniref:Uncharacterized protein n=1 Tax=Tritonibacter horizontis TaxID=1768241 RepID=A0A132BSJ0_9RHOB|nr:hypothetical protein TRIHO_37660 [Tritonibacter horizontis]
MLQALLPDQRLSVLDRQAFLVQEILNAAQKEHVRRAVVSPSPRPFDRLDLIELTFPEPQHMGLNIQPFRDFADGAKGVRGLGHFSDLSENCGIADGPAAGGLARFRKSYPKKV